MKDMNQQGNQDDLGDGLDEIYAYDDNTEETSDSDKPNIINLQAFACPPGKTSYVLALLQMGEVLPSGELVFSTIDGPSPEEVAACLSGLPLAHPLAPMDIEPPESVAAQTDTTDDVEMSEDDTESVWIVHP